MDNKELELKEKEVRLLKRGQDLGMLKFLLGGLVFGLIGYVLDLDKFIHTKNHDDRQFLVNQIERLREPEPVKRLENIRFLKTINGTPSEYLNNLEKEAVAEIEEVRLNAEAEKRTAERQRLEREQREAQEIERARQAELAAIAEKEEAQKRIEEARVTTMKAHDAALQEAYPGVDLFELKRRGAILP